MSPSISQYSLGGKYGIHLGTVSTKVLSTEYIPASGKEREERKLIPWPLRMWFRSCRHHLCPDPLARTQSHGYISLLGGWEVLYIPRVTMCLLEAMGLLLCE